VAIAGAFALGSVARSKPQPNSKLTAKVETPSAMSRIRPAKGAVVRKSVDLA
jgi:hypothetical protein